MANEESVSLNLGTLRSQMRLTLHTHHASRMWRGRAPSENSAGIIGLNVFLSIINKIARGASQDDPYSDWWLIRIEEKINDIKSHFAQTKEQLEEIYTHVPAAMSLGENLNLQPASIAIFAKSPLGFMAIFLLAEFDEIARRLILAHHTALIDRGILERHLDDCAHHLRSLFTLVQHYRYSGTTREDFAAGNAAANAAIQKLGDIPVDILDGTRRSRFAPPIHQRSHESSALEPFTLAPSIDQGDLSDADTDVGSSDADAHLDEGSVYPDAEQT